MLPVPCGEQTPLDKASVQKVNGGQIVQISYEKGNLKGTYPNVPEGVLWCLCVCVCDCVYVCAIPFEGKRHQRHCGAVQRISMISFTPNNPPVAERRHTATDSVNAPAATEPEVAVAL